jgi:hypothetical protein
MSINLDADSVFGRSVNHCLYIHIIARSSKQEPSGGMRHYINIGVFNGAKHALRLFFACQVEIAVNGGHNKIQVCQDII